MLNNNQLILVRKYNLTNFHFFPRVVLIEIILLIEHKFNSICCQKMHFIDKKYHLVIFIHSLKKTFLKLSYLQGIKLSAKLSRWQLVIATPNSLKYAYIGISRSTNLFYFVDHV